MSTNISVAFSTTENSSFKLKIEESLLIAREKPALNKVVSVLNFHFLQNYFNNQLQWLSYDDLSHHMIPIYPAVRIQLSLFNFQYCVMKIVLSLYYVWPWKQQLSKASWIVNGYVQLILITFMIKISWFWKPQLSEKKSIFMIYNVNA